MNQIVRHVAGPAIAERQVHRGFRRQAAARIVDREGRAVFYGGDGERAGPLYKFVTRGASAKRDFFDTGTLYVARFEADAEEDGMPVTFGEEPLTMENGTVAWKPVVFGEGPLIAANGFSSQADVLTETRRAAALLGATRMDRLQEVVANPQTGTVQCMLASHTIEIAEAEDDFGATHGAWEVLLTRGL